jgi:MFS family permease
MADDAKKGTLAGRLAPGPVTSPGEMGSPESSKPVPGHPLRNISFLGMTLTQFLGAFNDNLYKQLILLISLDYKKLRNLEEDPFQSVAQFAFAIPFVLFSGGAGYLSDKLSKSRLVVFCKVLEIFVMAAAAIAFLTGGIGSDALIWSLIGVLFFMGAQSALFGPAKYGMLPELLDQRDLPRANGIIQMTTFLAIIFGTALSGMLKDLLPNHLYVVSLVCVGIAIIGTLTSLMIRRTESANPGIRFTPECLLIERSAFRMIMDDKPLLRTILVYTVFWFAGGVMLPLTNLVSKDYLGFSETLTSIATAAIGLGIGTGCMLCGKISNNQIRFDFVRKAGFVLLVTTGITTLVCVVGGIPQTPRFVLYCLCLIVTGISAGVFAVPLQVFIQARPPASAKGRVLGAMALTTWIGITFSAVFYFLMTRVVSAAGISPAWIFLSIGAVFLATVLLFRERNPEFR